MTKIEQRIYNYLENILDESAFRDFYHLEWNDGNVYIELQVPSGENEDDIVFSFSSYKEIDDKILPFGFEEQNRINDKEKINYVPYLVQKEKLLEKYMF